MSGGLRPAALVALALAAAPAAASDAQAPKDAGRACAPGPSYRAVGPLGATPGHPVRTDPASRAPVVARLPEGAVVRVLDCRAGPDGPWLRVETERGLEGWASAARLVSSPPSPETAPSSVGLRGNGMPFDETGSARCARASGETARDCPFGAIRLGAEGAVVWIGDGDGRERRFVIEEGALTAPAEGATLERRGDRLVIRADGARFELPAALLGPR